MSGLEVGGRTRGGLELRRSFRESSDGVYSLQIPEQTEQTHVHTQVSPSISLLLNSSLFLPKSSDLLNTCFIKVQLLIKVCCH